MLTRLVSLLGLRRRFVVDGVRYAEVSAEPLERALSRRGRGFKEYAVTFPDGSRMRIRATLRREYADLGGDRARTLARSLRELVRPGMRVLVLRGGTGALGESLGQLVGPSGGVVSIEPDEEAARYAARRYLAPHVGFEHGWVESLRGEVDGAFDLVVCIEPEAPAAEVLGEAWRVVAPGGWLVVALTRSESGGLAASAAETELRAELDRLVEGGTQAVEEGEGEGGVWMVLRLRRPVFA